jgi:predicted S18 family serine protease
LSDPEIQIVTPEKLGEYLAEADAAKSRHLAVARLAFAEALAEAERVWIDVAGKRLGWEAKP